MTGPTAHHILVITDDSGTGGQLQLGFTRSAPQCRVGVVRSRQEIQTEQAPYLILLDLMLSSESPFEVLRWLRAEPRFAHVPVFVLGSKVVNHEIDEAYALGANSCLLKESELNGFEKIVRAIAAYVGLITTPGCECVA